MGTDIDNNIHNISSYSRFRNGRWENVKEYTRRNPDDIINNNSNVPILTDIFNTYKVL